MRASANTVWVHCKMHGCTCDPNIIPIADGQYRVEHDDDCVMYLDMQLSEHDIVTFYK
jgi:hypothetical protein